MKRYKLIFFILMIYSSARAQKYLGTKPQTLIIPTHSVPVFIDSAKFRIDINELKVIKDIYRDLKKKNVNAVYNYGFSIDTLGRTILTHPENKPYLISLNNYVETKFNKYKWIPAHNLKSKKCKLSSLSYFKVFFNTEQCNITIQLGVLEENGRVVFSKVIYM